MIRPMLADYHMHTPLCKHAKGRPEEYARRALELGMEEIGFADHCPMPEPLAGHCRMDAPQYPEYIAMVEECRRAVPQLRIKLGLEADYFHGMESYVAEVVRQYDFDYVIGSIHYLGDWEFDNPKLLHMYEGKDIYALYEQYYGFVVKLAGTGSYDVMGHMDLIKKFGFRPGRDYEGLERRALEAVARAGMALDVNTAGLRYPAKEIYPSVRILRMAREMGIGITLGSDAHDPAVVGKDFDLALAHVKAAGHTHYRSYMKRCFRQIPLP